VPHNSILAPSLLAGQHTRLAESAAQVAAAGAPWLHLDIMDGHFVPNLTFGPQMVAELRREVPGLFFDVHLMLDEPQRTSCSHFLNSSGSPKSYYSTVYFSGQYQGFN